MSGYAGDTLAVRLAGQWSAIGGTQLQAASPARILFLRSGRSSGLVDVGTGATRTPNQRATMIELAEGLRAASVNCWPTVEFDLGRSPACCPHSCRRDSITNVQVAELAFVRAHESGAWRDSAGPQALQIPTATKKSRPWRTCWWWAAASPD